MRHQILFVLMALALGASQLSHAETPSDEPIDVQVGHVLDELMQAWGAGDATRYAQSFTEDADFVPYFGIHLHGREAIVNAHQPVFDAFLKGTKLHLEVDTIRSLTADVVLVHTRGAVLRGDSEEAEPKPTSLQSFVMVEREHHLVIEAFQNTQIQPPPGPPQEAEH